MGPYEFDRKFSVTQILAGVDEAGRGPLAGPVVVAAVILPENPQILGLNDSKKIPPKRRESLFQEITETAVCFSISIIPHDVIDSINILAATLRGMREAVNNLKVRPQLVIVDGNQKPKSGIPELTIVKGDGQSAAIMAASILAKVTRDRIMVEHHEKYPQYGFDAHKGYGAATHIEAIRKHGPSPIHRLSFEPLKSMRQEGLCLTTTQESLDNKAKTSPVLS